MPGPPSAAQPPNAVPDGNRNAPPAQVPLTVADLARNMKRKAEEAAEKAEDQIQDWMGDYGHTKEMRKVLFDGARIGCGALHGPIPESVQSTAVTVADGAIVMELVSAIKPVARWADVWNLFPDPACGEDIHAGSYFVERVVFTKRQLQDMKRDREFIAEAVQSVTDQGPGKVN